MSHVQTLVLATAWGAVACGCQQLPGRCDQLLQQSVSGDQGGLSADRSRLLSDLVSATGRELPTGVDLFRSDAVLAEVLTHNNNIDSQLHTYIAYKHQVIQLNQLIFKDISIL